MSFHSSEVNIGIQPQSRQQPESLPHFSKKTSHRISSLNFSKKINKFIDIYEDMFQNEEKQMLKACRQSRYLNRQIKKEQFEELKKIESEMKDKN